MRRIIEGDGTGQPGAVFPQKGTSARLSVPQPDTGPAVEILEIRIFMRNQPIGLGRLIACPTAVLCIEVQELHEYALNPSRTKQN